jgi:SAM-dependent methyltransferase
MIQQPSHHITERMMDRDEYLAFHQHRHKMLLDLLRRHVPQKIERSLDVGGAGDLLNLSGFVRETFGAEAHTVDLGDSVAEGKSKGLISQACNVDTDTLPYPDTHFDLVIFASIIEHLYNPAHALDEIHRVLKPGGLLLLEAPNAVALGRRIDILKGRNPFRWFNEYNARQAKGPMIFCSVFYSPEEIETLLANHNFEFRDRNYGLHQPKLSFAKRAIRSSILSLIPRASDCFAIIAAKK